MTDVSVKECAQTHEREVFATPTYTGTDSNFPGEATLTTFANDSCLAAFEPYVGRDYPSSELAYGYLLPSPESWATGDRVVVCVLGLVGGGPLTGSMQGSGR